MQTFFSFLKDLAITTGLYVQGLVVLVVSGLLFSFFIHYFWVGFVESKASFDNIVHHFLLLSFVLINLVWGAILLGLLPSVIVLTMYYAGVSRSIIVRSGIILFGATGYFVSDLRYTFLPIFAIAPFFSMIWASWFGYSHLLKKSFKKTVSERHPNPIQYELLIFAGTVVVCICSATILRSIYFAVLNDYGNDGFGLFLHWALLYGLHLAVTVFIWLEWSQRFRLKNRYLIGIGCGILSGLAWNSIMYLLMWPFFLCFSYPGIYFWIAGGIASFLYATYTDLVFQENLRQYKAHNLSTRSQ